MCSMYEFGEFPLSELHSPPPWKLSPFADSLPRFSVNPICSSRAAANPSLLPFSPGRIEIARYKKCPPLQIDLIRAGRVGRAPKDRDGTF